MTTSKKKSIETPNAPTTTETPAEKPILDATGEHIETGLSELDKELSVAKTKSESEKILDKLGEEFSQTSIQKETLNTLKLKDKGLDSLTTVQLQSMNIFVGWNILGSVYKKLLLTHKDPTTGIININNYEQALKNINVSDPHKLHETIQNIGADINGSEMHLLDFLNGNSLLATEYKKKIFPTLATTMEKNIKKYASQYNKLIADHTRFDTLQEKGGKIRSATGGRYLEAIKTDPVKTSLYTAGIIGGVRVGNKILGSMLGWGGESKEKKKSGPMKYLNYLLKLGMLGGGASLLYYYFTKKRPRDEISGGKTKEEGSSGSEIPDVATNPEKAKKTFESLDVATKELYNNSGNAINDFYTNLGINSHALGSGIDEHPGIIPLALNSTGDGTVSHILSEHKFLYELGKSDMDGFIGQIKNQGIGFLQSFLTPFAHSLSGLTATLLQPTTTVETFCNRLRGNPDALKNIQLLMRKSTKTSVFLQHKKHQLEEALIAEQLKTTIPNRNNLNDTDKKNHCETFLQHPENKKNIDNKINTIYRQKTIFQALKVLEKYNLLNGNCDEDLKKSIKNITQSHNEIIDYDEKDHTNTFDEIKEHIDEKKFSENDKKKITEMMSNTEAYMDTQGSETFFTKVMGPLGHLGNIEGINKEDLLKQFRYTEKIQEHKTFFDTIKKKISDNTITKEDLTGLENTIKEYFDYMKEIELGTNMLTEVKEENGSFVMRVLHTLKLGGEEIVSGIQLTFQGNIVGGVIDVAQGVFAVAVITYPLSKTSRKIVHTTLNYTVKPLGNLTLKGLKNTIGYGFNIGRIKYPSNNPHSEHYLKRDLFKGNISIENATATARRLEMRFGNQIITQPHELLRGRGIAGTHQEAQEIVDLMKKYGNNKSFYQKLFDIDYIGKRYSLNDFFKLDISKVKVLINMNSLNTFKKMENIIGSLSGEEKILAESIITHSKDILSSEKLISSGKFSSFNDLFQGNNAIITPKELGSIIGKNGNSIDDIGAFLSFIEQNRSHITNGPIFVRNVAKKRSTIKNAPINGIDEIKNLNKGHYEKLSEKLLGGIDESIKFIKSQVRVPARAKSSVAKTVTALENMKNSLSSGFLRSTSLLKSLGTISGLEKISDSSVQGLKTTLTDVDFFSQLSKTKNLDEIKKLFAQKNITDLPEELLKRIATSKNPTFIKNIVEYSSEYKSMSNFQQLTKDPVMRKIIGRTLAVAGVSLDILFIGLEYSDRTEEITDAELHNKERAELKTLQRNIQLGASVGQGIIGVLGFIPGAGWVALGGVLAVQGAKEVIDMYYGVNNFYTQNMEDFRRQGYAEVKNAIISSLASGQDIDRGFAEGFHNNLQRVFGNATIAHKDMSLKTSGEALKALIWLEEAKNYPWAMVDANQLKGDQYKNEQQLMNQQATQMEKKISQRLAFLSKYYPSLNTVISTDVLENGQGLAKLEKVLHESTIYATNQELNENNEFSHTWVSPEKYISTLHEKLSSETQFTQLEEMRKRYPQQLLLMLEQLPSYKVFLDQHADDNPKYHTMIEHLIYLKQYKQYLNAINGGMTLLEDHDNIDLTTLDHFVEHFSYLPQPYDTIDTKTHRTIEQVSPYLGYNILFRFAETLGFKGKNTPEEIKKFFSKEQYTSHVLYVDGNNFKVYNNGIFDFDETIGTDVDLKSNNHCIAIFTTLLETIKGSILVENATGTGNEILSKELYHRLSSIVTEEISIAKNKEGIKKDISTYIQQNATHGYIKLPIDMIIAGKKSQLGNLEKFYFKRENGKISSIAENNEKCEL